MNEITTKRGVVFTIGQRVRELDWPYAVGTIEHFGWADGCDTVGILVRGGWEGRDSLHTRTVDLIVPA